MSLLFFSILSSTGDSQVYKNSLNIILGSLASKTVVKKIYEKDGAML